MFGLRSTDWLDQSIRLCFVLLLPTAAFAARAGGVVFWLLALLGIAGWWMRRRSPPSLAGVHGSPMRWLWAAALMPLALNAVSVWWFGMPARDIAWWPLLGLPLIALAAARVADAGRMFIIGAWLACLVSLGAAAWSRFVLGEPEPRFMMNPLLYGNIAFIATLASAWSVADRPDHGWRRFLPALAALAGAASYVASGIRGGLLALPLLLVAFMRWGDPPAVRARVPWRSALVVLAVLAVLMMVFQPRNALISKLERVSVEISDYAQGRTGFSNVGERLAMWQAAAELFRRNPVFGVGAHRFSIASSQLRDEGLYPKDAHIYRHAHSTYITVATEYGLVGLAVMAMALYCLVRALRCANPPYRTLGLLLLGVWLCFAMANDILTHQALIRGLAATVAVFATSRFARA